ncbi:MAG TPA: CAP domain-containing protein, partial [Jatrophihabitans sp.]|nr:CAP domain-containing protein [Jatrophihabitans sp.]
MSPLSILHAKPTHAGRVRALVLIVGLLLGVFAVATSAAQPAGASVPRRTGQENAIAWSIKKLIDRERAQHHLPALRMNRDLRLSARRHDVAMAHQNTMSHQLPGEPFFGSRMSMAGYKWNYAGENIAWNSDMSQAGVTLLQNLMYGEKPPNDDHRLNILSRNYRDIGVDVYMDNRNHKVW